MSKLRLLAPALAVALAASACGGSSKSSDITIANAWARQSPSAVTTGAVYLEITSKKTDTLVAVRVAATVAKSAQMHEMVAASGSDTTMPQSTESTTPNATGSTQAGMSGSEPMTTTTVMGASGDGEMMMQEVSKIDLPTGTTVSLKPGGYHIMLIDLVKPLVVGTSFDLTLTFGSGTIKTITVPVRENAP